MKKKNIISNVTMLDRFTQSEKDIVKGGKGVNIKGTVSVNYKGVTTGSIEISNNKLIGD